MKLYIRSASTLDDMVKVIKARLKVDGVRSVEVCDINSKYASVKLLYDDGSQSDMFSIRFHNIPSRKNAQTQWNPNWTIRNDGAVLDQNNSVIGWFKLTKHEPQVTTPNYLEDSLIVDYGTHQILLTESSGSSVAEAVKPAKPQ